MRARRRAVASRLGASLRGEPDDVRMVLPYEEVIAALGFVSERRIGLQVVTLDTIVGSVDRAREFDRSFRPTSGRVRSRWEHIAAIVRRGESLPPVDLLRPYEAEDMTIAACNPLVGNVRNNGPEMLNSA